MKLQSDTLSQQQQQNPSMRGLQPSVALFVSLFRCVVVLKTNVLHFPWYVCIVFGIS